MSGDYTRFTHDPLKRRSGVLMQQGRVQLDSDWNEFVAIAKRRQRLQSLDTFGGPLGVPHKTTPDAFLIGIDDGPPLDLTIEPGRLYVDGHLAELFESDDASYLSQPYLPDPPDLPAGDAVVYIDLWEREVTYVEDPALLDVALGGADTATRTQTVWQVRVDARDGAACGMEVGEPASAGRLTSEAIAPPAPDDPCILPPASGYRGLENRLYRVEIHDGGALGTARFKWSRDNGSIVSVVRGLTVAGGETTLTVNRIGRDPMLRFRIDDWVTVTDDHRELMGEPGEMARVVDIVESRNEIVLDRALPTGGVRPFGANTGELLERHTRLQRWDQTADTNTIDGDGLITTAAGPIDLEDGIRISLETVPAGGLFRTGDYWVFAARVATASVEILDRAPPRGIVHHYAQLAAISALGGGAPQVADCRPSQEAEACCCTVVVSPGESIQDAIDSLPPEGGCVCLKPGVHDVPGPVTIGRSDVVLTGESLGAVVRTRAGTVLAIEGTPAVAVERVRVHGIRFEGSGRLSQIAIATGAVDLRIEDCGFATREAASLAGLVLSTCEQIVVSGCTFAGALVGIWATLRCASVAIVDCLVDLSEGAQAGFGAVGLYVENAAGRFLVNHNEIIGVSYGVVLNDDPWGSPFSGADGSIVRGNRIVCLDEPGGDADTRPVAVDIAAGACVVEANQVNYGGALQIGIRISASDARVLDNVCRSSRREAGNPVAVAVQIGVEPERGDLVAINVQARGNTLAGPQNGIIVIRASDTMLADNHLSAGDGQELVFGIVTSEAKRTVVSGNTVGPAIVAIGSLNGSELTVDNNTVAAGRMGITLVEEASPTVRGNRLEATSLWGILAFGTLGRTDIAANRVIRCGHEGRTAWGIAAGFVMGEYNVEANEVMDTGVGPGDASAATAIGLFGDLILEARVAGNLVTYSSPELRDPGNEDRALLMRGLLEFSASFAAPGGLTFGFPIQILGNKFIGPGRSALVELTEQVLSDTIWIRFERVTFNDNYCAHFAPSQPDERLATVSLRGRRAIVMGNHVKATMPGYFSFNFNGVRSTYVGNMTEGSPIHFNLIPTPHTDYNQIG